MNHDFLHLNLAFCVQVKTKLKHKLTPEVTAARHHMAATGWSYRKAADHLGCSFTHLAYVLTGRRVSASLIRRILNLPAK